jgi:Metallopeptidase family M24
VKFEGFDKTDLQQFSKVQNLAYECVEAVQAQLQTGMTEKDAVRLLREWLAARGVTHMFHDPFAWFGKRAAFKDFWINIKFLPSKTRLEPGMPVILDVAPIVDGYSSDIGYCFVHGGDAAVDKMDQVLMQVRDHIVQAVRQGKTMRAIYQEVDAIIESAGFINVHRYYPHRVLGHRMGRLDTGLLHRVRWLGFGLRTYVKLTSRTWLSKAFPKWVESPLWNDGRECDHRVPEGLWAVEPHIATPDQRVGTKWEELLVVTKDNAYWLNHDAAHCRRATDNGWWKTSERSALAAFA